MAVSGGLLVINSIWRPRRSDRPPAASLPHRQHPGQQLPDARPSGSATRYRREARRGRLNMTAVPAFFLKVSNFQLTLTLARAAARLGQRGGRVARPALPSPDPRCYASFHTVSPIHSRWSRLLPGRRRCINVGAWARPTYRPPSPSSSSSCRRLDADDGRGHTRAAASRRHVDRQVVAAELPAPVAVNRRFAEECQPVVGGRPPESGRRRGVGQDALRRDHALHHVDALAAGVDRASRCARRSGSAPTPRPAARPP